MNVVLFTICEPDLRRELYSRLSVTEPTLDGKRYYSAHCHRCQALVLWLQQPTSTDPIDASRLLGAFSHVERCGQ